MKMLSRLMALLLALTLCLPALAETSPEDVLATVNGVAVTCGAKVLGNLTMRKNSLAAAGAVVLTDVPENAIVGGVPAKIIGYKSEDNLDFQG